MSMQSAKVLAPSATVPMTAPRRLMGLTKTLGTWMRMGRDSRIGLPHREPGHGLGHEEKTHGRYCRLSTEAPLLRPRAALERSRRSLLGLLRLLRIGMGDLLLHLLELEGAGPGRALRVVALHAGLLIRLHQAQGDGGLLPLLEDVLLGVVAARAVAALAAH